MRNNKQLKRKKNFQISHFWDYSDNYLICLSLPFLFLDLLTRIITTEGQLINLLETGYLPFFHPVPLLFTILYSALFIGITLSFKKTIGKKLYIIFNIIAILIFLIQNIYYSTTNNFFSFKLLELTEEGSAYIIDAIKNTNLWIIPIFIVNIYLIYLGTKHIPDADNNNYKLLIKTIVIVIIGHYLIPILLGSPAQNLSYDNFMNTREIYNKFSDKNRSMTISGIYEYTVRDFYITYMKQAKKELPTAKDKQFLKEAFQDTTDYQTEYTGLFKGKNVIFLQLESIDNWLLTKETMPNLYSLTNNAINFQNHYSYYNGGGSTFNSEFAVNTGFITPISYTENAYNFHTNSFPYSLANLFRKENYTINSFHMNNKGYYLRDFNYQSWGYDNYYGLKDYHEYKFPSYVLDTELIKDKEFEKYMFPKNQNFLSYIITFSNHMPFSPKKGICKILLNKSNISNKNLSEEECIKLQAKETDDMIGLMIEKLKEKDLYENTVIVAYADHYLYTIQDKKILSKYKETNNNLINHTPFFIWSYDLEKKNITEVTSQLNILPTVINLFGLEYHPNYYIGTDALNSQYKGITFFSDYSWYDGNNYVMSNKVIGKSTITKEEINNKTKYINKLIHKNDLALKYNYFKTLHSE